MRNCTIPVQNCTEGSICRNPIEGMDWNWDHIRYFLSLAEQGTLSQSARVLGVSHSTVLRRIRRLESVLKTTLFDHTSAGYTLTPAGQKLHIEATSMRSTMSAISREISGVDSQMQGDVVITTTDTIARYIAPRLIARLSEKYAGLNFSLIMANRLSDLDSRDVDIAIRTSKQPPEHLIGRQVAQIRFFVVASAAYLKKYNIDSFPARTSEHKFILPDESYNSAPFYQWLHSRIDPGSSVITVNNFLSAAAMVKEGLGIAVLPSYVLRAEKNLISLGNEKEICSNDLWVLSHPGSRNTEKIRVVRQFLYDELPRYLD